MELNYNIILSLFSSIIQTHPFLVAFFVPLIGGEPFFLLLAFLAGTTGILPLWILFISGTIADILDDILWFYCPKWKFIRKIKIPKIVKTQFKKNSYKFKKIEKNELLLFILTSKFLIGTRNLAIMSISLNKIKFRKFLPISILSSIIWSCIIIGVGWSTGKGFILAKEIFNSTRIAISILILFIIIMTLIRHHTHRKVKRKLLTK